VPRRYWQTVRIRISLSEIPNAFVAHGKGQVMGKIANPEDGAIVALVGLIKEDDGSWGNNKEEYLSRRR
jgi:hypothetical protein